MCDRLRERLSRRFGFAVLCGLVLASTAAPRLAAQAVAPPQSPAPDSGTPAQADERPRIATSVEVFGRAEPAKTTVTTDPQSLPANVSVLQSLEIRRRTYREPAELLRSMPGVDFVYYGQGGVLSGPSVRGYTDRNFGQDIAGHLDGIPLNAFGFVASHGALDLTPIFPESIDRINLVRGPLEARFGDFDRGASLDIVTKDRIDRPSVSFDAGSFGTARLTAIYGNGDRGQDRVTFYSSVDGQTTNGYSDNQGLKFFKTFHKVLIPFGHNEVALSALAFTTTWDAPGYLDLNAVTNNTVSKTQAVNPTDGGDEQSQLAYVRYRRNGGSPNELAITGYVGHSNWRRFRSDFIISPTQTQVRQIDRRTKGGYRIEQNLGGSLLGRRAALRVGTTLHRDDADTRQANTLRRDVLRLTDDVPEVLTSAAGYGEGQWQIARRVKLTGGLRVSRVHYDIDDRLRAPGTFVSSYSASQVNPKGGIAVSPVPGLEVYANAATGMRSPAPRTEVRNSIDSIDRVQIAEIKSYETGARWLLFERLDLRGAIWRANNTNEIRGIPPGGTQFESLGRSRRTGEELEARWYAGPATRLFTALSWVDPRLLTPTTPGAVFLPDVAGYVHQVGIDTGVPVRGLRPGALVIAADASFYGARSLNTLGTLRSEPYSRLAFRGVYEPRPRYRVWVGGFAYPGSRLGESEYLFGSTIGVRPNPTISVDAGLSYTF